MCVPHTQQKVFHCASHHRSSNNGANAGNVLVMHRLVVPTCAWEGECVCECAMRDERFRQDRFSSWLKRREPDFEWMQWVMLVCVMRTCMAKMAKAKVSQPKSQVASVEFECSEPWSGCMIASKTSDGWLVALWLWCSIYMLLQLFPADITYKMCSCFASTRILVCVCMTILYWLVKSKGKSERSIVKCVVACCSVSYS